MTANSRWHRKERLAKAKRKLKHTHSVILGFKVNVVISTVAAVGLFVVWAIWRSPVWRGYVPVMIILLGSAIALALLPYKKAAEEEKVRAAQKALDSLDVDAP